MWRARRSQILPTRSFLRDGRRLPGGEVGRRGGELGCGRGFKSPERQQPPANQVRERGLSRRAQHEPERRSRAGDGRERRLSGVGDWRVGLSARPFRQPARRGPGRGDRLRLGRLFGRGRQVRFYKGASSDFASAALLRTEGPVGAGASWGMDSILNSAGASFEALFDGA